MPGSTQPRPDQSDAFSLAYDLHPRVDLHVVVELLLQVSFNEERIAIKLLGRPLIDRKAC